MQSFTGGLAPHQPAARHEPHRDGDGPSGVLHLHRVGHHDRAGRQERKVLPMLRRALPGKTLGCFDFRN